MPSVRDLHPRSRAGFESQIMMDMASLRKRVATLEKAINVNPYEEHPSCSVLAAAVADYSELQSPTSQDRNETDMPHKMKAFSTQGTLMFPRRCLHIV